MTNKTETISGRLLQFFGVWKIQTGYGTFPLAKELQGKLDVSANGEWCVATVRHGEVIGYHFAPENIDGGAQ